MIKVKDIYSLSDFQRNTKTHLKSLKESGRPEMLTVNGEASVVIQDATSCERMAELAERAETIEFKTEDLNAPEEADGTVDLKVVDF